MVGSGPVCAVAFALALAALSAAPSTGAPAKVALLPDLAPVGAALADHSFAQVNGRVLLRFPAVIANIGDGPLHMRAKRNSVKAPLKALQLLKNARGKVARQVPVGEFEYHEEHNHWHLLAVAEYRLLRLDGTDAVEGTKTSFCLLDSQRMVPPLPGSPLFPQHTFCPSSRTVKRFDSGVSVGWADVYPAGLHGQELDVTGVPPGQYRLQIEVDPLRLLTEKTRDNNTVSILVNVP
jgi:hypothetical protein